MKGAFFADVIKNLWYQKTGKWMTSQSTRLAIQTHSSMQQFPESLRNRPRRPICFVLGAGSTCSKTSALLESPHPWQSKINQSINQSYLNYAAMNKRDYCWLTANSPCKVWVAINGYRPARAINGVISVSRDVASIPSPKSLAAPNLGAIQPPGICVTM